MTDETEVPPKICGSEPDSSPFQDCRPDPRFLVIRLRARNYADAELR